MCPACLGDDRGAYAKADSVPRSAPPRATFPDARADGARLVLVGDGERLTSMMAAARASGRGLKDRSLEVRNPGREDCAGSSFPILDERTGASAGIGLGGEGIDMVGCHRVLVTGCELRARRAFPLRRAPDERRLFGITGKSRSPLGSVP